MKIETFIHEHVKRDGTFEGGIGSVEVDGCIRMSEGEGCGLDDCHCSDGHWISIVAPRDSYGVVRGMIVRFDDGAEMKRFFFHHELNFAHQ